MWATIGIALYCIVSAVVAVAVGRMIAGVDDDTNR